MLGANDSILWHSAQNFALIFLSLLFLPLDTFILAVALLYGYARPRPASTSARSESSKDERYNVLVTGVGMSKGLILARVFSDAGHTVIGADFERGAALVCGRASRSLSRFYSMSKPDPSHGSACYVQDLVRIIKRENIHLWVSCSGVASAIEDGEAREAIGQQTSCKSIQFTVKDTATLHEKHSFIEYVRSLGLTVPETHLVTTRSEAEQILLSGSEKKFILKCVGMDDSSRGDMTLLPLSSERATKTHVSRQNISASNPWIVQQFVQGREYCTHSLVVAGEVKVFTACPSLELLMHYEALPDDAPLTQAMLKFTKTVAARGGRDFTGHLSFDFLVEDESPTNPDDIILYPIECNPRAHTAVVLFSRTPKMIDAYLDAVKSRPKSNSQNKLVTPVDPGKYYWVGHDLIYNVVLPLWSAAGMHQSMGQLSKDLRNFLDHLLNWRDGTFSIDDPVPWWWLYHVYWPMKFLQSIFDRSKWSRINVSTTKMFMC